MEALLVGCVAVAREANASALLKAGTHNNKNCASLDEMDRRASGGQVFGALEAKAVNNLHFP
jgi:hypothetical protein